MKKTAIILCLLLLLPTFLLIPSAETYGQDSQKLIITHINVPFAGYEGTGIIYSESSDGTISPYGSFDWWNAVVFEWSDSDSCYVVKSVNTAMNSNKASTAIPENGFVYCCNVGNDYPALGDTTKPDYTSEAVTASCNYVANLKVGDKAYLYGADLLNKIVDTDDTDWYADGYVSNAFIKIGSEESGEQAYNPDNATVKTPDIKMAINAMNGSVAEGQAMILTPKSGAALGNGYDWCRIAIFDWSDEDEAYVLKFVDTAENTGRTKNAVIPPNGFALSVNTGNDYPSIGDSSRPNYKNAPTLNTYEKIATLPVGTKVFLVGIDLAAGTFEYEGNASKYYTSEFKSNAHIVVSEEKPESCYTPNLGDKLDAPVFSTTETVYLKDDVTVAWNAVDGAEAYYVHVTDSSATISGKVLISKEISETEFTVSGDLLTDNTTSVTVSVYAKSAGKSSSAVTYFTYKLCSERAYNSPFRDKTIVAFGDSITAGSGGWVSSLFGELGTEVINAGVGGNVTEQALSRIENDVLAHEPDIVIVNFGMNDQAYQESSKTNLTPIDTYEANYRSIIEQIQASGSKVILVAVHDVNPKYHTHSGLNYCATETLEDGTTKTYVDKFNEVVYKLSQEYNTGFLDINSLAQADLDTITIKADGIHLSAEGQAKYGKWISDYCYEFINQLPDDTSSEESSNAVAEESDDATVASSDPLWLNIIVYLAFIAGISVVGVMFINVVKKNKGK